MDKKKKINVDSTTLKFIYTKYKDFGVPIIVIIVCTVLLVGFLVPQYQDLIDLSGKLKESEKNQNILNNNYDILSSLNESSLDSQWRIVSTALPANKDFIGIINAITYASSISGVGIGDFQLQVGELSEEGASSDSSSTAVSLTINTDIEGVNRFTEALSNTLPLSEITGITTGDLSSSINLVFHHKPLPSTESQGVSPITPLENNESALINKLANFNYIASEELDAIFEIGTSSGDLSKDF